MGVRGGAVAPDGHLGRGTFGLAISLFYQRLILCTCCFTDSTYRRVLLVRSSFCCQLVLGLPPPPSIRTFEMYGPGTVFAVHHCHLGRTGT